MNDESRLPEGQRALLTYIRMFGLPEPDCEVEFHPNREWRFDAAWRGQWIAVEIDGGAYSQGRHVRPKGFEGDCEKLNEATAYGWRVLRFTPQMLERDPARCMGQIATCLARYADPDVAQVARRALERIRESTWQCT